MMTTAGVSSASISSMINVPMAVMWPAFGQLRNFGHWDLAPG
jgi:hypothetical protein